jgi:hypothetical protein
MNGAGNLIETISDPEQYRPEKLNKPGRLNKRGRLNESGRQNNWGWLDKPEKLF